MANKATGKKVTRIISVILLIVVGAVIAFGVLPKLYKNEEATTNIIMLTQDVAAGTYIEESMLAVVSVGAYGLDSTVIKDTSLVVGKFALENISSKDLLFPEDFSETDPKNTGIVNADIELADDQMLLTLELGSIAAGAAGNILPGDKVNVAVYRTDGKSYSSSSSSSNTISGSVIDGNVVDQPDLEDNETEDKREANENNVYFPESLQGITVYRVLTSLLTSVNPEYDVNSGGTNEKIPQYITLICTQEQADLLVEYAYGHTLHFIEVE